MCEGSIVPIYIYRLIGIMLGYSKWKKNKYIKQTAFVIGLFTRNNLDLIFIVLNSYKH